MKLPWLRPTWQQLLQSAQQQRLSHAIALPARPHLGTDKLIQQLTQWLLCQAETKGAQACGRCKSCQLAAAGHHPDFYQLGGDESVTIGVDAIRTLQRQLAQSPHQGAEKVAVIHNAQTMTVAATNALLKTLEEPSSQTTLIIASDRWDSLLPTMRSRLQYYHVHSPDVEGLAQWLTSYAEQAVNPSEQLRTWCDRPLAALARLKQHGTAGLEQSDSLHQQLVQGISHKEYHKLPQALELLDELEVWLRDLAWLNQGGAVEYCRLPGLCQSFTLPGSLAVLPIEQKSLNALQRQLSMLKESLQGAKGLNCQLALNQLLSRFYDVIKPQQRIQAN